jgi:hypothetical protein
MSSRRSRVLARLQLSYPLSFRCVRFESTRYLGFEHASALCTLQLGRFLQEARCAGSLLKVACLLAAVCFLRYSILLSRLVSISPALSPHYGVRAASFKARVGGYPVSFDSGAYPHYMLLKLQAAPSLYVPTSAYVVCPIFAQVLIATPVLNC